MKKLKKEDFKNWWNEHKEVIKYSAIYAAGIGTAFLGAYIYDTKIVGYNGRVEYVLDKYYDDYIIGLGVRDKNGKVRKDKQISVKWSKEVLLKMLEDSIDFVKEEEKS